MDSDVPYQATVALKQLRNLFLYSYSFSRRCTGCPKKYGTISFDHSFFCSCSIKIILGSFESPTLSIQENIKFV
jgi:hypothetical protein